MSTEEGSSKIFQQDYIDNEVTSKAEEEKPKVGYIEEVIFLLFTIPNWAGDVVSFLLALILVYFSMMVLSRSKPKKNMKAKKELVKQDEQVKQDRQVKQDGQVEQVV
ncbi:hypothetical protein RhiirA4_429304 [Rhizophagus irregularis]|uniref:Uncharacterized protein n=1 Tax=Rhizophagus irregularis TaxID=588596 RepID=A0A2I1HG62_9GLOM|nr:hypothetical protein RhiirA4_429304 [Rhizophagus irregularis]